MNLRLSTQTVSIVLALLLLPSISAFAQSVTPDDARQEVEPLLEEARNKSKAGNKEEALALYSDALRRFPNFYLPWFERGIVLLEMDRIDEGIADLDKSIELEPELLLQYSVRGVAYYHLGKYAEAITDLSLALIDARAEKAFILPYRALSYFGTEQYSLAIRDWTEFIPLSPQLPDGYIERGQAYYMLERLPEAKADFDKSIELKPDFWVAYFLRGRTLSRMGKFNDAVIDFDKFLPRAENENRQYGLMERAIALARAGEFHRAKKDLDLVSKVQPDTSEALIGYSLLAFELYDTRRLLTYSASGARLYPKAPIHLNNLGYAHLLTNDLDLSRKEIDAALEIKPDFTIAINNRALLAIKQERYDDASIDVKRVIEADPELPEGYLNRGYINFAQKKYQAAVDDFTIALEKRKDHVLALEARAKAYKKLGKKDLAEADAKEAQRLKDKFAKLRKEVFGDVK